MTMKRESDKNTSKIILDSNALFVPDQLKIDIFEELKRLLNRKFELVLLEPVQNEMKRLAQKGSPQMRKKAAYALTLTANCRIAKTENAVTSTDEAILRFACASGYAVFTNDKELRKKLRNINVPVIYVRQKSHLEVDGRL